VNDGSPCTSVVRKLPVLLTAAISRVIETIGVRASTDDGLTCGIERLIGGENDVMGGETVLMGGTNGLIAGENDLTDGENGHADGENDLVNGRERPR